MVQLDGPQMIILHMRIACWITKATNTHSEYVILTAFPRKQANATHCYIIRTFPALYFVKDAYNVDYV